MRLLALCLASILPSVALAQSIEPGPVSSRSNRRAGFALIVGVERTRDQLPPATFAAADAELFSLFAEKTLGIPRAHIRTLVDARAGSADIEDALVWLKENAGPDSSIWFYFSGHGTPSVKDGEALLVPYDADPRAPERRGIPVPALLERLAQLPGKERFVILDACFSGTGKRSVVPEGKRPLLPVKALAATSGGLAVFSATEARGTSGPASQSSHGLFTFHFLQGLRGAADRDGDGVVTAAEQATYVRQRVSQEAREQGGEQLPQISLGELAAASLVEEPILEKSVTAVSKPPPAARPALPAVATPAPAISSPPVSSPPVSSRELASLSILSTPSALPVFLDGRATDKLTPCVLDVPAGNHRVEVRVALGIAGQELSVAALEARRVLLDLPGAALARLVVTSLPPGATITLDGKEVGTAPVTLESIAPGPHHVFAHGESGQAEEHVELGRGAVQRVDLELAGARTFELGASWTALDTPGGHDLGKIDQFLLNAGHVDARFLVRPWLPLEVGLGVVGSRRGNSSFGVGPVVDALMGLRLVLRQRWTSLPLLSPDVIALDFGLGGFGLVATNGGADGGLLGKVQLHLWWFSLGPNVAISAVSGVQVGWTLGLRLAL